MNTFDPNAPAKLGHSKPNAKNYTILLHWRENPTQLNAMLLQCYCKRAYCITQCIVLYCIELYCIVLHNVCSFYLPPQNSSVAKFQFKFGSQTFTILTVVGVITPTHEERQVWRVTWWQHLAVQCTSCIVMHCVTLVLNRCCSTNPPGLILQWSVAGSRRSVVMQGE